MATRTIGTELRISGESEYNAALKSVNSNLGVLRAEMSAVSEEYKGNEGSIEALSAKNRTLTALQEQQAEKVSAMRDRLSYLTEAYGENSAAVDKAKKDLYGAEAALSRYNRQLAENQSALDEATGENEELDSVLGKVKAALIAARPAAAAAANAMGKLGSGAAAAARGIGNVVAVGAKGVAAMGVLAGGATVALLGTTAALTAAAKSAADEGDPAFAGLAENLEGLQSAATAAKGALGRVLLPSLEQLSGEGAALLRSYSEEMQAAGTDTAAMGAITAKYVRSVASMLRQQLPEMIRAGSDLLGGLLSGMADSGPELSALALDLIDQILTGMDENSDLMVDAAVGLIDALATGALERAPDLLELGLQLLTSIIEGMADNSDDLVATMGEMITRMLMALAAGGPDLLLAGGELLLAILNGILTAIPQIVKQGPEILRQFKDSIAEKLPELKQTGAELVHGIWDGITGATGWLWDKLTGWVDDMVDWIKSKLDIHSPSRRMAREVGAQLPPGIGEGFASALPGAQRSMVGALDNSLLTGGSTRLNTAPIRSASQTSRGTVIINIQTQQVSDATVDYIIQRANREIGGAS